MPGVLLGELSDALLFRGKTKEGGRGRRRSVRGVRQGTEGRSEKLIRPVETMRTVDGPRATSPCHKRDTAGSGEVPSTPVARSRKIGKWRAVEEGERVGRVPMDEGRPGSLPRLSRDRALWPREPRTTTRQSDARGLSTGGMDGRPTEHMARSVASKDVWKAADGGRVRSGGSPTRQGRSRLPSRLTNTPRARARQGRRTTAGEVRLGQGHARGGIEGWRRPKWQGVRGVVAGRC